METRWRSEGTIRSEAKGGLSDSVIGAIEQDDKKRSRKHEDRQLQSSHNNRHRIGRWHARLTVS